MASSSRTRRNEMQIQMYKMERNQLQTQLYQKMREGAQGAGGAGPNPDPNAGRTSNPRHHHRRNYRAHNPELALDAGAERVIEEARARFLRGSQGH
jgi:hypothetical protein